VSTAAPVTLDRTVFRDVIGHFASGVTIITARDGAHVLGTTASAVSSLSLEPPMLLVCLNRTSQTGQAIARSGRFAVNILGEDQGDLATHFASKGADKFATLEVRAGQAGQPLLADALAQLECEVADTAVGGTHTVFLGEVRSAHARPGSPLTYFRGRFGRFVEMRDDATYRELRHLVLERRLPLEEPLLLDALAAELGVNRASVFYALTRLTQDGLVSRQGASGYSITPVDAQALTRALAARLALTLGVVELVIDDAPAERLAAVRLAAQATVPAAGNEAEERSRLAVADFHEQVIGLARNPLISETYRNLSVPAILARALWGVDWSSLHARLAADRLRFADALERRDRAEAIAAVTRYTDEVRAGCLRALEAAGGRL
jgi:4-nitrophenol 2-monooxygenase / 4-nitrocatechol 4-monooxygenase, reductase component